MQMQILPICLGEERPVEIEKIRKGDIWLHSSNCIAGLAIRIATQSPVNHAGQIVENDFLIHALIF